MRWITNITSGRPASYSSKISATGRCSAHGTMPSWNSVTCWPSRSTTASLPTRSSRLMWPSRLTRTQGQFSRAATCSMWTRLSGAVQPLHHHAPVAGEAGQQRERHVGVEAVGRVDLGHVVLAHREGRHAQVGVDAEGLAHREHAVGTWGVDGGHGVFFPVVLRRVGLRAPHNVPNRRLSDAQPLVPVPSHRVGQPGAYECEQLALRAGAANFQDMRHVPRPGTATQSTGAHMAANAATTDRTVRPDPPA
jgi:hypothetical protein